MPMYLDARHERFGGTRSMNTKCATMRASEQAGVSGDAGEGGQFDEFRRFDGREVRERARREVGGGHG